jgi:hypothetical protein
MQRDYLYREKWETIGSKQGKARQGWMVYLCLAIDGVTVTAGRNSEQRVGP